MGHEIEDDWEKSITDHCKENAEGENLNPMETNPFVLQWMVWRKDPEARLGISLNIDEADDKMEVASIANESLDSKKSRRLSTFPSTRCCDLKTEDITEAVNIRTVIEEIQRELRTAPRVQVRVTRPKYCEAPD